MARLSNVRRIIVEDFPKENQEMISKIGNVLNFFMEEVINMSNGNVDYENLNKNLITVELSVNANGVPVNSPEIQTGITNPIALKVIRSRNLTSPTTFTNSEPVIHYTENGTSVVGINKITGLIPNNTYSLVIEVY